jgi:hypothetical protein
MKPYLAWAFYGCGDAVSRVMNLGDWVSGALYPLYNWLMCKSTQIQGNGPGPWGPVQSSRDEHAG